MKSKRSAHILLVDDNQDDLEYIAYLLQSGGSRYRVTSLLTGDEAIEYVKNHHVDCVILDVLIGAESGLIVLAAICRVLPALPVIMLTGQGDELVAAECIKQGALDYLVKDLLTQTYLSTAIENALVRSELQARLAAQDLERRQYLKVLSHDLKAPLRQISQFNEMIEDSLNNNDLEDVRQLMAVQSDTAKRAYNLISVMADFALLDKEVEMARVSLTDIANAACADIALEIETQAVDVDIQPLFEVYGNTAQLVQVFRNMVTNSIKYNESAKPQIVIQAIERTVLINDNGLGIAKEHLSEIFLPMRRLWGVNSQYEGTGLGLAIAKKIIEQHGGRIWCTSKLNEGTTMHLWFPEVDDINDDTEPGA